MSDGYEVGKTEGGWAWMSPVFVAYALEERLTFLELLLRQNADLLAERDAALARVRELEGEVERLRAGARGGRAVKRTEVMDLLYPWEQREASRGGRAVKRTEVMGSERELALQAEIDRLRAENHALLVHATENEELRGGETELREALRTIINHQGEGLKHVVEIAKRALGEL